MINELHSNNIRVFALLLIFAITTISCNNNKSINKNNNIIDNNSDANQIINNNHINHSKSIFTNKRSNKNQYIKIDNMDDIYMVIIITPVDYIDSFNDMEFDIYYNAIINSKEITMYSSEAIIKHYDTINVYNAIKYYGKSVIMLPLDKIGVTTLAESYPPNNKYIRDIIDEIQSIKSKVIVRLYNKIVIKRNKLTQSHNEMITFHIIKNNGDIIIKGDDNDENRPVYPLFSSSDGKLDIQVIFLKHSEIENELNRKLKNTIEVCRLFEWNFKYCFLIDKHANTIEPNLMREFNEKFEKYRTDIENERIYK